ncbi:MAG: response regulator transcription factor [Bacteroidota bacterium]
MLVDDHSLIRDGLKTLLANQHDIVVIGSVNNGKEAVDFCQTKAPNVILMDISMPVMNGLEALKKIKSINEKIKVILLSMEVVEEHILTGINNKMSGYLPKDVKKDRLIEAINRVNDGEEYFDQKVSEIIFNKFRKKELNKSHLFGKSKKLILNILAVIFLELIVALILWIFGL